MVRQPALLTQPLGEIGPESTPSGPAFGCITGEPFMPKKPVQTPDQLVAKSAIANEFGVSSRTISRWMSDASVGFPKPVDIRGLLYFSRSSIEEWKRNASRKSAVSGSDERAARAHRNNLRSQNLTHKS